MLNQLLDAYFDYDQANLRHDAQTALNHDYGALRALLQEFPNTKFMVEGNCDERGSAGITWLWRAPRESCQGVSDPDRCSGRAADDDQLWPGTTCLHGPQRRVLAENRRAHLTASR